MAETLVQHLLEDESEQEAKYKSTVSLTKGKKFL